MLFLELCSCLLDAHALPSLDVELVPCIVYLLLFTAGFVFHVSYGSLELLQTTLLLSGLVSDPFGGGLFLLCFFFQPFVLFLHLSDFSVELFLLGQGPSSFLFDLVLDLLDLLSSQLGFPLHGHKVFVVVASFVNFLLKFELQSLDFFYIKHALSSFFFESSFQVSHVTVSSEILLLSVCQLFFFVVQDCLELFDAILVD